VVILLDLRDEFGEVGLEGRGRVVVEEVEVDTVSAAEEEGGTVAVAGQEKKCELRRRPIHRLLTPSFDERERERE
jgi:hypothetical protein